MNLMMQKQTILMLINHNHSIFYKICVPQNMAYIDDAIH